MREKSISKAVYFNTYADEHLLARIAGQRSNFSRYVKELIRRDLEGTLGTVPPPQTVSLDGTARTAKGPTLSVKPREEDKPAETGEEMLGAFGL